MTLVDGTDRFVVTRSASDSPDALLTGVTVLAQNEIEAVGAHESGRLHLIDRYRSARTGATPTARAAIATLRSATSELRAALTEVHHLGDQVRALADVPAQLEAALHEQASLLADVAATEAERQRLSDLQERSASLASRRIVIDRGLSNIEQLAGSISAFGVPTSLLDAWPDAGSDPLDAARQALLDAAEHLEAARRSSLVALQALREVSDEHRRQYAEVDAASRELRTQLNAVQEGAGAVTRRVDALRESAGQIQAMQSLIADRRDRVGDLRAQRAAAYAQVDLLREDRFAERSEVADRLTTELSPRINVVVTKSQDRSGYVAALVAALRGSGLHYNELAPQIAAAATPLELVQAAEDGDAEFLVDVVGVSSQRAMAIIQQLQSSDTSDIVAAPIDDGVEFHLLDGSDYKSTAHLSIGQRCTVVLPLLLSQHGDVLIVDQPEDHIDNAFITSTLVSTLRSRQPADQFIFTSHNPNIPVLGEADCVIHMDSDGRRGFKRSAGPLDDPSTVEAITSVMEGGAEAFMQRARFYMSGQVIPEWSSDDEG